MLNKITKFSYIIRIILFILHFYFLYASLYCILSMTFMKYIFLILYSIYIVINIMQILSKKQKYQNDLINNFMHCGIMLYVMILSFRMNFSKIYVTNLTVNYFNINYCVLSILIVFTLIYSFTAVNDNEIK